MCSLSTLQTELAGIPAHIIEDAITHAKWRANELCRAERWRTLMREATDAEIIGEGQKYAGTQAVVLAQTYGHVSTWQELVAWADFRNPRRPVLMKGSKESRIAAFGKSNHNSANGWAECVAERAARLSKITAFTSDEFEEQIKPIIAALHERYCLSHHFSFDRSPPGTGPYSDLWRSDAKCLAWVGGRCSFLTKSERVNLQRLRAIIQKTERLDDRVKAAKVHWKERMAA